MDKKDILAYTQSRVIFLQNEIIHSTQTHVVERANKIAIQELLKLIEIISDDLSNEEE